MRLTRRTVWTVAGCSTLVAAVACSSGEDPTPDATAGAGGGGIGGAAQGGSAGTGGDAGRSGASGNAGTAGKAGAAAGGAAGSGGSAGGSSATGGNDGGGAAGAAGSTDVPTVCDGNCHYVRAAATGANDGSSWSDAYTELPDALVRGHAYFVAAGTYPDYEFDDAPSGGARIRVLRATPGDHGDPDGWDDAYAAGEAVFGELDFTTASYDFDGRGAVHAVGSFRGTVVDIGADDVDFRGVDVDGAFAKTGDQHTAGACTGISVSGDGVVVRGNRIHDIADDGVVVGGSDDFSFEGNEVDSLYGCGTDGGCGPCDNGHSDGLEIYSVKNSRFVGNFAHDIASTSTFFFGNWADELGNGPSEYCENILLANNVLYNPPTGFVAYIEDARNVQLFHNTIWGKNDGRYGGLAIGVNVSDLLLVNNVILSINYEHLGGAFDPTQHGGDYNLYAKSLGQWQDGEHDLVANDPGFTAIPDGDGAQVTDPTPADFTPESGSPLLGAGTSNALYPLPATDFFGAPRATPPTIGAIE